MPNLFPLTDQELRRDRPWAQAAWISIPLALLMLWCAWMYFARINVYAATDEARVEVAQTAFIVQAPVSGRVIDSHLALGDSVKRGDVLVNLEAAPQQLQFQQEQAHQAALTTQISDLRQQMATERATLGSERAAAGAATEEARANLAKAQAEAEFSKKEAEQKAALLRSGLTSQIDADRQQVQAAEKLSELAAARQAVARSERQQKMQAGERQVRIQELAKQIAEMEGQLAASSGATQQIQQELGARRIVASGDGRLGEVAPLRAGSFVRAGDRLAAIIPDGRLRVVANFPPSEAIGRVKSGQKAWLRLDGFPAAEYGPIVARVVRVGNEVRDGKVQVELAIQLNPRIPLQHGLPGTLEVQVDRISPASYILRKAGGYLAGTAATATPNASPQGASEQEDSRQTDQ